MNNVPAPICPGCGLANGCAIAAGRPAAVCWCMASTTRLPAPAADSACYCATCLHTLPETIPTAEVNADAC
ncbi:MAG: cysteine-rich CWC family protein [Spongiibacteraceae bacterium]